MSKKYCCGAKCEKILGICRNKLFKVITNVYTGLNKDIYICKSEKTLKFLFQDHFRGSSKILLRLSAKETVGNLFELTT